jgi:hypothetical protein
LVLAAKCRWWRSIEIFSTFASVVINGIKEETLVQRLMNRNQTVFELLIRFFYPRKLFFSI